MEAEIADLPEGVPCDGKPLEPSDEMASVHRCQIRPARLPRQMHRRNHDKARFQDPTALISLKFCSHMGRNVLLASRIFKLNLWPSSGH